MKNLPERERELWEHFAATALAAVLATETHATVEEAAAMSVDAADRLIEAWNARFGKEQR